jgi:hypothetical protein
MLMSFRRLVLAVPPCELNQSKMRWMTCGIGTSWLNGVPAGLIAGPL